MNTRRVFAFAVIGSVAFAASAVAAPLNLTSAPPDVHASNVGMVYQAVTHPTLSISGAADLLTLTGPTAQSLFNGAFTLTATFTKTGSGAAATFSATSASLTVTGKEGSTAGSLQTFFSSGTMTAFGYTTNTGTNPAETFEFIFNPGMTGTSLYGSSTTAAAVEVILHTPVPTSYGTGFLDNNVDTTTSSTYFGNASADIFAVTGSGSPSPEPSSVALVGLAVPMLMRRRKA